MSPGLSRPAASSAASVVRIGGPPVAGAGRATSPDEPRARAEPHTRAEPVAQTDFSLREEHMPIGMPPGSFPSRASAHVLAPLPTPRTHTRTLVGVPRAAFEEYSRAFVHCDLQALF